MRSIREGRDVRALTAMLDRVYSEEQHVEEPHSLDELAKLTPQERRILLTRTFSRRAIEHKSSALSHGRVPVTKRSGARVRGTLVRAVPVDYAVKRGVAIEAELQRSMATLFAASYPERTRALALFHPVVAGPGTADREWQERLSDLRERWGTREFSDELLREGAPTLYANEEDRRWSANWLRLGATPAVAYALNRAWLETDLRDVLPSVRVPTLVLYRSVSEQPSLEVASLIPGARAMRLSGEDYFDPHLSPELVDELEHFVAGGEAPFVPESVLTTVMFTDLVGSTEHAAELGDRESRDLLARHHALVRRELALFRGEERDTAGDGFFATFDGPARAIRAGQAIVSGVRELGLDVRVGIHVGECELHEGKVSGIAVNIGARIGAVANPGELLVSSTVRDLVAGLGLKFDDRGARELKGIPGTWHLFAPLAAS